MPEELTDIVLIESEKKMDEGEEIQQLTAYASTIAQFVFKRMLRSNERQNQLIEESPEVQKISSKKFTLKMKKNSLRQNCFEQCLAEFDAETESLSLLITQPTKKL